MGLLKKYFSQDPEKIEQKGDAFLKASDCKSKGVRSSFLTETIGE